MTFWCCTALEPSKPIDGTEQTLIACWRNECQLPWHHNSTETRLVPWIFSAINTAHWPVLLHGSADCFNSRFRSHQWHTHRFLQHLIRSTHQSPLKKFILQSSLELPSCKPQICIFNMSLPVTFHIQVKILPDLLTDMSPKNSTYKRTHKGLAWWRSG